MNNRLSCSCVLCQNTLSSNNLEKHFNGRACRDGLININKKKYINCKFCNLLLIDMKGSEVANHVRWCEKNPKFMQYRIKAKNATALNNGSQEVVEKRIVGIKMAHLNGKYENAPKKMLETKIKRGTLKHTYIGKENIKIAALNSNHQRVCKKSHTFIDKKGRKFIFDSKWEDELAIRLDNLNISWTRPAPIKWEDSFGKIHNYFPDFYLLEYDVYIDPKNEYAEKQQKEKIDVVSSQIKLVILRSLDECKNFVPFRI